MDAKTFDKSRLPSRHLSEGPSRAPQRDAADGTPREFCTISVTDSIAIRHQGMEASPESRKVIAGSIDIEPSVRGRCCEAMVGLAGCDKSLPGAMMSMLRLNIPAVFMYGGSILSGKFMGRDGKAEVVCYADV